MDTSVYLALIVAIPATVSPILMAWVVAKQRRADKQEDWRREDQVAARALTVAAELSVTQEKAAVKAAEVARLLLDTNEQVAATAKVTNNKLDVIHTLVNSNMTSALQDQLIAIKSNLIMAEEVIALKKAQGQSSTEESLNLILGLKIKISELEAQLNDRLEQTKKASAGGRAH